MSPSSSSSSSDDENMAAFASVAVDAGSIAAFSQPAAAQGDELRSGADANAAGDDEEAMPAVFQDKLWAALDRKLAAGMAVAKPTHEREPQAAGPDDPGDTGIRLFSRVPEGAALQEDAVNRRQTAAPQAQQPPGRKKRRQLQKVTLEDLEAVAVDPQQLLDFSAKAAEEARLHLGPPLQTLFEPDDRQHGVRLPPSLLQQSGVPACLRADLEADDALRRQCTFWRPAYRRQQALEKEAAALRQQQLLLRRQAQAAARRVAGKRPKGKAGKSAPAKKQKRTASGKEAAIFEYLLGKG